MNVTFRNAGIRPRAIFWLVACVAIACESGGGDAADAGEGEVHRWHLPSTFDGPPTVPADNAMTSTRIALGRALFFDPRLSADGTVSCGSCHRPERAFADSVAVSTGVHDRRSRRNAPSLLNVAYATSLFAEGGVPSLELQSLAPGDNRNEMGRLLSDAAAELSTDHALDDLAQKAYGKKLNTRVMAYALAAYQRSLISSGSPYDAFIAGDSNALDEAQRRGMNLFFSEKTQCSSCHSGFLFTDHGFHNIGLYAEYADIGRERLTHASEDRGRFKTPSLRNVAVTAPYMHDGSMADLDEVISFLNAGGHPHPNRDERIRALGLDSREQRDLKAFLHALTDTIQYPPAISR